MPHIGLPPNQPGMVALGSYRPDVYTRLASLADLLLQQQQQPSSTLSPGDRVNRCDYCHLIHGAVAAAHLHDTKLVDDVKCNLDSSAATPKMKKLLGIACMVQRSGRDVTAEAVESAKMDVHDTVLIAATFCMFNRYVDGLATEMPGDVGAFLQRGPMIAQVGYQALGKRSENVGDEAM